MLRIFEGELNACGLEKDSIHKPKAPEPKLSEDKMKIRYRELERVNAGN